MVFKCNKRLVDRFLVLVIALIMMITSLSGVHSNVQASKKIKLKTNKLSLYIGETYQFKNKKCKWRTSNKKIAIVSSKGKVRAKKSGNVKITAIHTKSKKKAVCKVTVGKYATALRMSSADTVILKLGQVSKINASVQPSKVLYKNIIYQSENATIAEVSKDGIITPLQPGITSIIVSTKAVNNKKKIISKKITVVVLSTVLNITQDDNKNINNISSLVDNNEGFTDIIMTGDSDNVLTTMKPVKTSTPDIKPVITAIPENSNTPAPTATSSASSTPNPVTQGPNETQKPYTTNEPTKLPVVTVTPTTNPTAVPTPTSPPATQVPPMTPKQYVDSLVPDANSPIVGSFSAKNSSGVYRTYYLLNRNYTGNFTFRIDNAAYSANGSVNEFLNLVQNEYAAKDGASIRVERKYGESVWTAHIKSTGAEYYFSGRVEDTLFKSPYGLMIFAGNTLANIQFDK